MNNANRNPDSPLPGNSSPQSPASPAFVDDWRDHSYIGNGFSVANGIITVHNPSNIRSFFDLHDQPNNSPSAKEYAANISRALKHHSDFHSMPTMRPPLFDNPTQEWFNGFVRYNYPNRDPNAIWNSRPVIRDINRFSK
jgi:hypothetical protein